MNSVADKPPHGEKTHPLRPGSIEVLRRLARYPIARREINAGIRERLAREDLAREGEGDLWTITPTGLQRLAEIPKDPPRRRS
jgi:hypothetical protein